MNSKIFYSIIIAFLCMIPCRIFPQTFTEIPTSIQALLGSSDWGDYDLDGDLDLLVTGTSSMNPCNANVSIYTNTGGGQFAFLIVLNMIDIHSGTAKWLDYNNDGILDIFISGLSYDELLQNYIPTSKLYKGLGYKKFEETDDKFCEMYLTSFECGDINNDGSADIAISGYTDMYPNYHAKLYENNNGSYVESAGFKINPLINGTLKWGDYDNDQDLDLLQTGMYLDEILSQEVAATYLYRNDGDSLVKIEDNSIIGVGYGSAEWGDYDSDGDLDILLSGASDFGTSAAGYVRIYRNEGNDNFYEILIEGLSNSIYGRSRWGDCDNDGDLDILVTGYYHTGTGGFVKIYKNYNGVFTSYIHLCDVTAKALDWVDYDNDGDLDIFLLGSSDYTISKKLFRNNAVMANEKPSASVNTNSLVNRKMVLLSWSPAEDDHTDSRSLTYNISVGLLPTNSILMGPNSFLSDGYRKIVAQGNASVDTCWDLVLKYESRYYWQVQAIDNTFAGSEFSETGSFVIGSPILETEQVTDITSVSAVFNGNANPLELNAIVFFEYKTDTSEIETTIPVNLQGDSIYSVNSLVMNLAPNTNYFCRIKAINDVDTVSGEFVAFRTSTEGITENHQGIKIFPNPGDGIFFIGIPQANDGEIMIFDQLGRRRYQVSFKNIQNTNVIDIRNLESGLYLLVYSTDKYVYHGRIEKL